MILGATPWGVKFRGLGGCLGLGRVCAVLGLGGKGFGLRRMGFGVWILCLVRDSLGLGAWWVTLGHGELCLGIRGFCLWLGGQILGLGGLGRAGFGLGLGNVLGLGHGLGACAVLGHCGLGLGVWGVV